MKLRPILAVTLSIISLCGCKKDKPQEKETPKSSTRQVMSLDELGKQFVENASNGNSEAIQKLFITQDELKATLTGANIDATYLSIKEAFEASIQEIIPGLRGAIFVRMNMEFCPEPVPVNPSFPIN